MNVDVAMITARELEGVASRLCALGLEEMCAKAWALAHELRTRIDAELWEEEVNSEPF